MFFLAVIFGVAFGISIASWITYNRIGKSNMMGDSKGEFKHFSRVPIKYYRKEDNVRYMTHKDWEMR